MNLPTLLFRLPLMRLRGFGRLAEMLHDQAERELRDPASVRRQLEQAEQARVAGEISDDELASRACAPALTCVRARPGRR